MRKVISFLIIITLVIGFASSAYAQTAAAKLGRGVVNTLTGLWEVPIDILKTCKADGVPTGLTVGTVRGLATGIYRTLVGLYEVVTFAIPAPAGYRAITDPATLMTSETLESADPKMAVNFSLLGDELSGKK